MKNKKIFVTGGSRGIGEAIVRLLAERGAQVAFSYSSNKEKAEALLKELPGTGHFCVSLQLTDSASVDSAVSEVFEKFGELDGLVNNAGVTRDQLLLRMKEEDFDTVIQTNLKGTFLVTKACVKNMLKARKGSIVSITSVIGQSGNAGQANYAASKAGIEAFSRSLASEIASRNIRVNCIAPGFIQTDMTEQLSDEQKKAIVTNIPLGRVASPHEVASCVAFLLGEDSTYITGHTLNVNGGMLMR